MAEQEKQPATQTVRVGQADPKTQKAMDEALAALDKEVPLEEAPSAEKAEQQPDPVQQSKPEPAPPCERCGYSKDEANRPNDEDIQEYARAILGGRQFTKTYRLMTNQIVLTFSTLDGRASEHLNNIIISMNNFDDAIAYNALVLKYRILFLLREYTIGGNQVELPIPTTEELPPGDFDAANKLFSERIEHLDQGIVQMIAQSLMLFRSLESALIEGAFDETFWKGAGPC